MLLTTKLKPPGLPLCLLPRTELEAQLSCFTDHKLVLVSAPAGYGKTTLVAGLIRKHPVRYAWYSLDATDTEATSFWSYLIHSLRRLDISIGKKSLALLNAEYEPDLQTMLVQLLEDLNKFQARYLSGEHVVIVLDDFQVIQDEQLLEHIEFFLDYLPDNFHLVVISRAMPSLHIARRSARGELLIIEKEQLQLSAQETETFLSERIEIPLAQAFIGDVVAVTNGWLGALQVLCTHLKIHKKSATLDARGSLSHLVLIKDYIDQEVLNCLDSESYSLLGKIALLPRFSEDLMYEFLEEPDGKQRLQTLQQLNLIFLQQDDEGSWYSVHTLIRERLFAIEKGQEPDADFVHRVLNGLAERELWSDVFEFAILTEQWDWASKVAIPSLQEIMRRGEYQLARTLIARFPGNIVDSLPKLSLFEVWTDFHRKGHDEAKIRLERLSSLLTKLDSMSDVSRLAYGISGNDDWNQFKEVVFISKFQVDLLSNGATNEQRILQRVHSYAASDHMFSNWCWNGLGANAFISGQVDAAIDYLSKAFYQSQTSKDGLCLLVTLGSLGPGLIFAGKVDQAIAICDEAEQWCNEYGFDAVALFSIVHRVRVLIYRECNQPDQISDALVQMKQAFHKVDPLHQMYHMWAELSLCLDENIGRSRELVISLNQHFKGRYQHWNLGIPDPDLLLAIVDLLEGKYEAISRWVFSYQARKGQNDTFSQQSVFERLIYYRFLLNTRHGAHTEQEIKQLVAHSKQVGNLLIRLKGELFLSVLYFKNQDFQRSASALLNMVETAVEHRLFRSVLDEQQLLLPMLNDPGFSSILQGKLSVSASRLLGPLMGAINQPSGRFDEQVHLKADLTNREQQVLIQLEKGLSNEEIGNVMDISTTTVKSHVSNIFGKLQVKNRTQAISKARAIGLPLGS
jgi:LuxR family maltose regulon positive regulatory protein